MNTTQQPSRNIVLVVDDSAETVAMLAEALENNGATALVALRGERALSIVRQVTPDAVLMDAVMPGMDGFETCRRLKSEEGLSHVPVIFMTGLSDTDHIIRGLEAGGVDYVTKPIDVKELMARIKVHLANARVSHAAQNALDTTGRHLMAMDGGGRLVWWTPQAGKLISRALGDGFVVGSELPGALRDLLNAERGGPDRMVVLGPPADGAPTIQAGLVGRSGPNEFLLRLVEDASSGVEDILSKHLDISGREAQVLLWLAQGKSNRDIADILGMSPRTVNKHLERIFKKIGVENRTSAAAMALKLLGKQ